jgi:predicted RNA-binding protein
MCESNAYLLKNGEEELLMESVGYLKLEGDQIILRSIFGEQTTISGALKEMNLTAHKIIVEEA